MTGGCAKQSVDGIFSTGKIGRYDVAQDGHAMIVVEFQIYVGLHSSEKGVDCL